MWTAAGATAIMGLIVKTIHLIQTKDTVMDALRTLLR